MDWDEIGIWESFEWFRSVDGCEVVTDPGQPPDPEATNLIDASGMKPKVWIQAKSDRVAAYNPHREQSTLFHEFAQLEDTAEAACDFVARFGFLGGRWMADPPR